MSPTKISFWVLCMLILLLYSRKVFIFQMVWLESRGFCEASRLGVLYTSQPASKQDNVLGALHMHVFYSYIEENSVSMNQIIDNISVPTTSSRMFDASIGASVPAAGPIPSLQKGHSVLISSEILFDLSEFFTVHKRSFPAISFTRNSSAQETSRNTSPSVTGSSTFVFLVFSGSSARPSSETTGFSTLTRFVILDF